MAGVTCTLGRGGHELKVVQSESGRAEKVVEIVAMLMVMIRHPTKVNPCQVQLDPNP